LFDHQAAADFLKFLGHFIFWDFFKFVGCLMKNVYEKLVVCNWRLFKKITTHYFGNLKTEVNDRKKIRTHMISNDCNYVTAVEELRRLGEIP
jgi:hypothetical protein